MNLERLRWGEWIAAIAAINLLLVTFRSWYKVTGTDLHVTAWDALEQGRYLLIATAVAGIFLWLIKAAEDTQQLSFPPGWITAAVGFACTVYIAYRLATPPADNLDADVGLYLGLLSALGVTAGGLMSARESEPGLSHSSEAPAAHADPFARSAEPAGATAGEQTWSPAAPASSTSDWSPSVPAATAAGALAGGERPLQSGDAVVLTAGGARFPSGTVAEVVEVFGGGALVEVRAADGMAERFEVPESAYERAAAGAAAAAPAGESWSPAMPAPASEDWGFDEPAAAGEPGAAATETAEGTKPKKTPWWKREIGGGKKKDDDDGAGLAAAAAVGAGAAAVAHDADGNGAGDEKPGFFKRLFGGGGAKDEDATETIEAETTPASDVAGVGQAAESDTAVDEPVAESAVAEPPATDLDADSGPEIAHDPDPTAVAPEPEPVEPEPVASAPEPEPVEPEPVAAAPEPEPEPLAAAPESEPEPGPVGAAPESEPEPVVAAPEPETETEPPAAAPESETEPVAPAPEPEATSEPQAPAASEPAETAEPEAPAPEPEPRAAEPEPVAAAPEPEPEASTPDAEAAGAGAAAAGAAAAAEPAEEKPKRKRSSGSRKVPKEALAAPGDASQPRVGDEVQLKVGGGKYDAGTRGTVVDVFSAGVIVELNDDAGRTERLDLPFEAIAPADA